MEEAEVRHVSGRSISKGAAAALGAAAVVLACALGGPALAQSPYDEPPVTTPTPTATPSPTPTPSVTPFQNPTQPPATPARPARLNPFPYVRTAGSYTGTRTSFTRVIVRAPKGSLLDIRCNARRCKRVKRKVATSRAWHAKTLQRSFGPKTTIEIRISSPTKVGKYVRIRTLRGAPPQRRDRCLKPGGSKPVSCEGL
jgi:hypothetical protein